MSRNRTTGSRSISTLSSTAGAATSAGCSGTVGRRQGYRAFVQVCPWSKELLQEELLTARAYLQVSMPDQPGAEQRPYWVL